MRNAKKAGPQVRKGLRREGNGKALKRLMRYVMQHFKGLIVVVIIAILLSSVAGVIGSVFLEILVDDYITPMLGGQNLWRELARAVLFLAGVYVIGILASLFYQRMMVRVSQGTLKAIRDDMFRHMQGLPVRYFDTHTHGDIMSHYTNDTDALRQMISQTIPALCSTTVTVVFVLVAMIRNSLLMTAIVVLSFVLMFMLTGKIGGKSAHYFFRMQQSIGDLNGTVEEMINGQKVVKVFCHEEETKAQFSQKNEQLCSDATNANKFAFIMMPIMMQMSNLQYAVVAIAGGLMALSGIGGITVGGIISFLALSKSIAGPIGQIAQQVNMVAMALAGSQRIFALMDEAAEDAGGDVTLVNVKYDAGEKLVETTEHTNLWAWKQTGADGAVQLTRLTGDVRLNHVDFSYVPDKQILHDITLYAEPGQKVAFVGATGAGKTTITNLLNRFYDIQSGTITYDGIPIRDINKADLRSALGIVLQDVNLFTGTILENIRYGNLNATDEECKAAAMLANAHDFIMRLPDGYNTVIDGSGEGLSQGQRQLLSIARCAVADPPVMILDEATSSIDTRTEALVQAGMDALMEGRTVFVIAHRLSTIQNSDVIMVMDHGRIIERGDHDKLIAEKGTYYGLYTGSFELE